MHFIKLIVDVNESIFGANKKTASLSLRLVYNIFAFLFYFVVIKPSGSIVNSGLSAIVPSDLR